MTIALSILLEQSFQIAWDYLERAGEIDDPLQASRFLSDMIEAMIRRGTTNRLVLSNRAITAFQKRNIGLSRDSVTRVRKWWPRSS